MVERNEGIWERLSNLNVCPDYLMLHGRGYRLLCLPLWSGSGD